MKILIVSPFFPYPLDSGGTIRIYNLIKHLSGRYDITLLSYINEAQRPLENELSPYCKVVTQPIPHKRRGRLFHARYLFSRLPYSLVYVDHQFKEKLVRLAGSGFDIVQFEFLPFAHYVEIFPKSVKKVVVEHYVAFESRKRLMGLWKTSIKKLYYYLELSKIRRYERGILDRFDLCLVTSAAHRQKLLDWGVTSEVEVCPNGVDTLYFSPLEEAGLFPRTGTDPTLVFMGAFHLEPANIDGLEYLLKEIFTLIEKGIPGIRLEVIGKGLSSGFSTRYAAPNIHFHGYIEDIRPVLGRAHAFLIPLRGGSGTKIRILTAMAMGIPVVATSLAANGIDVMHNETILIADTPQEFAAETVRILRDQTLNLKIGSTGRRLVEGKYNWKAIAEELDKIYRNL